MNVRTDRGARDPGRHGPIPVSGSLTLPAPALPSPPSEPPSTPLPNAPAGIFGVSIPRSSNAASVRSVTSDAKANSSRRSET